MAAGRIVASFAKNYNGDNSPYFFDQLALVVRDFANQAQLGAGPAQLRATVALTTGNLVSINGNALVLANAATSIPAVGIVTAPAAINTMASFMLLQGYVANLTGLVAGTTYYTGNAGARLAVKPGAGMIQGIGFALSTTELLLNIDNP